MRSDRGTKRHPGWKLLYLLNCWLLVTGAQAAPFTQDETITVTIGTPTVQSPGPSQALFNNPYYTCVTNRYLATAANGGSNSNDGTAATVGGGHGPWLTLAHAQAAAPSAGWCINVQPGTYSQVGVAITHGGNNAASNGYVVYRCTTLNGCMINLQSGFGSGFVITSNYVIIDGFVITGLGSGSPTNGIGIRSDSSGGNANNTLGYHHIWAINNIISGFPQAGMQLNEGEFFYAVHNTIYNNSHPGNSGYQGSGISYYLPIEIPSYTLTADDQNNPVTGNTGTSFRQFIIWNVIYNNYFGASGSTDGNGIIADDWQGDQFGSCVGSCVYVRGGLIAFNVVYNNGGGGVHAFASAYVTMANNSVFNNQLDTFITGTYRGNMDDNGSYGSTVVNNISYARCGAAPLNTNSAMGIYGNHQTWTTTLGAAITSTSQTSITLSSAANMPGGATWGAAANHLRFSGSYSMPGGNQIQIDSEQMIVTAGWGTTTLTVIRGALGTTPATHSSGATVTWIEEYYSNNVTYLTGTGGCSEIDRQNSPRFYSSTVNQEATNPLWVDVGNTSVGTISTQPVGTNFALQSGSPAINFGTIAAPFNFLPTTAVDAGACSSSLSTCP